MRADTDMTLNQPAPASFSHAEVDLAAAHDGGALWRMSDPTCTALLCPMAAEAFAALGDRADATVFAQAAERVALSFQSLVQRSAWTATHLYERARQPF